MSLAPTALYLGDFIAFGNDNREKSAVHDLQHIQHIINDGSYISQTRIDNLRGRLKLGAAFDEGGNGQVSKCTDTATGLQYVIKISLHNSAYALQMEAHFAQLLIEGRTAARCFPVGKPCAHLSPADARTIASEIRSMQQHPGFVNIHRLVHFDPTWPCILSEPCESNLEVVSRQLDGEFRRTGERSLPQRWRMFSQQIINGISYMHYMGIAHRDIKLPNIFCNGNRCFLADFGLATDARMSNDLSCTVTTRAPEVREGNWYDPKIADLYSVACTLLDLIGFKSRGGENNRQMATYVYHQYRAIPELWYAASVVLVPDLLHRQELYTKGLAPSLLRRTQPAASYAPSRHVPQAPPLLVHSTHKHAHGTKMMVV